MGPLERAADEVAVSGDRAHPLGPGVFVAVAGPSGVGKDTLINYARAELAERADIVFVRRVVTREADPQSEDHDTLEPGAFAAALRDGRFAMIWEAHGLCYGLPAWIDAEIVAGKVVVANISRDIIDALAARYANLTLVVVSAHPAVIAARLRARGRESDLAIAGRLARRPTEDRVRDRAIRLENSGPIEVAGDRLTAVLRTTADALAHERPA